MHEKLSQADQKLINRIKSKVQDDKTITLMQEIWGAKAKLYPPASLREIQEVEASIGFTLPPLIREIFLQVGNGGFGPGYGIAGLLTGYKANYLSFVEYINDHPKFMDHLQESMESTRTAPTDLTEYNQREKKNYEKWVQLGLHQGLVIEYCNWGCAVGTIINGNMPHLPVYSRDGIFIKEHSSKTLRQWWQDWLDGTIQQY